MIERTVYLAVLEQDIAGMPDRLDAFIGSKGVPLSSGQMQRRTCS